MSNRWKQSDVERFIKAGRVLNEIVSTPRKNVLVPVFRKEAAGITFIKAVLECKEIAYIEEYRFDDVRRFRFDIAILHEKIAIEYEGLVSEKSRHTTIQGFTGDCTKYNLAQLHGWRVLRYTAKNFHDFENDILKIL